MKLVSIPIIIISFLAGLLFLNLMKSNSISTPSRAVLDESQYKGNNGQSGCYNFKIDVLKKENDAFCKGSINTN